MARKSEGCVGWQYSNRIVSPWASWPVLVLDAVQDVVSCSVRVIKKPPVSGAE